MKNDEARIAALQASKSSIEALSHVGKSTSFAALIRLTALGKKTKQKGGAGWGGGDNGQANKYTTRRGQQAPGFVEVDKKWVGVGCVERKGWVGWGWGDGSGHSKCCSCLQAARRGEGRAAWTTAPATAPCPPRRWDGASSMAVAVALAEKQGALLGLQGCQAGAH